MKKSTRKFGIANPILNTREPLRDVTLHCRAFGIFCTRIEFLTSNNLILNLIHLYAKTNNKEDYNL